MSTAAHEPLGAFFARLDAGDAAAAAQFFAADAVYVRPAAEPSGAGRSDAEVVIGREAIHEFFRLRGRRPYVHEVRACVRVGDTVYGEGVAVHEATGPFVVFVIRVTLDRHGLFLRYVAGTVAMSPAQIDRLYC
jgi:ketosteroid isomerase-like protein